MKKTALFTACCLLLSACESSMTQTNQQFIQAEDQCRMMMGTSRDYINCTYHQYDMSLAQQNVDYRDLLQIWYGEQMAISDNAERGALTMPVAMQMTAQSNSRLQLGLKDRMDRSDTNAALLTGAVVAGAIVLALSTDCDDDDAKCGNEDRHGRYHGDSERRHRRDH